MAVPTPTKVTTQGPCPFASSSLIDPAIGHLVQPQRSCRTRRLGVLTWPRARCLAGARSFVAIVEWAERRGVRAGRDRLQTSEIPLFSTTSGHHRPDRGGYRRRCLHAQRGAHYLLDCHTQPSRPCSPSSRPCPGARSRALAGPHANCSSPCRPGPSSAGCSWTLLPPTPRLKIDIDHSAGCPSTRRCVTRIGDEPQMVVSRTSREETWCCVIAFWASSDRPGCCSSCSSCSSPGSRSGPPAPPRRRPRRG